LASPEQLFQKKAAATAMARVGLATPAWSRFSGRREKFVVGFEHGEWMQHAKDD